MRKKVSCRVIESVPLNQSGDDLVYAYPAKSNNGGFNAHSHSDVPTAMRVYFDNDPTTGMLNILA
ncbi:MAG: hypothetical protein JXM79_18500 [Sedimentisphaerales bacterium]|nr:hypothetical protein [Sedimentisphaerales bacterium]